MAAMRRASLLLLVSVLLPTGLGGCCGSDPPTWDEIPALSLAPTERGTVDLTSFVHDDKGGLEFDVEAADGLLATVDGATLSVVGEQGFSGLSSVTLVARDACGNEDVTEVEVTVGTGGGGGGGGSGDGTSCGHVEYTPRAGGDAVFIAGTFNGWDPAATPMTRRDDGVYEIDLDLDPGAYPYKLVEVDYDAGGEPQWACDPESAYVQCDEGYTWDPSCPVNGASCNSMLVIGDCAAPRLNVVGLDIDREGDTVSVVVEAEGEVAEAWATLDGEDLGEAAGWTGKGFSYQSGRLSDGRHTLRFYAVDADGNEAEPVYVPLWLDDRSWETGLLYYVFVDRFANGDGGLDHSEGTSSSTTDYEGGDWQGVINKLDYLDELGVTVLWLTAPQDNAEGAWNGTCNATYAGYHGYWPSDPFAPEEHFGDDATLRELIDGAHARGMRVLTDWVANHVITTHPYYTDHPDWFNPLNECGAANNWNDIPETCWFTSYLPDIRYYDEEPLVQMVDDAMWWVKEYELDGFRVDAVKHMPHSLYWNFASRVRNEVEYSEVGGDEDFYTVGETFSGDRGLIGSYVNPRELDAQFDFPLYWAITSAFAREEAGLSNGEGSLADTFADSQAAFGGAIMSTFLGNHDVVRFLAQASGEVGSLYGDGTCGWDGGLWSPDQGTSDPTPYRKLMLAWTFLLTSEGLPLVYYGDEIGLPGYADPDNRQMMRFDGELSGNEAMVLEHVRALGQARREHPAFATGTRTGWWEGEAGFYAYARTTADDQVLVLLNRDAADRSVTNGLAFAGLTATTWVDVLSGDRFTAAGDSLTVNVPARGSRVLVPE